MGSLYILLSAVLLPVTVWGFQTSLNGWTMTVADRVSAGEGGTAILPCAFTHPPPRDRSVNGSVMWFTSDPVNGLIFQCAYPGTDPSQGEPCENGKQQDAGSRFRFVGNLSNNDVSIMMERLSRADSNVYRCRVELNIDNFGAQPGTRLTVNAAGGNDSVVSGTEGASVTLPCTFIPSNSHTLTTVSWMRKEAYQHVVTFRPQSDGLWTTVNGDNRYELIGNPKEGNASIRIKQLTVNDSRSYLCLVEYTSGKPHYQYLIQTETRLQVKPEIPHNSPFKLSLLLIPLLILLLFLLVSFIIFRKKRGHSWLIGCTRSSERKDCGLASTAGTDPAHQQSAPGDKRFTINAPEDPQPDSCTYASVVIGSNREDQGGKRLRVADSEENVIYAAVVV
ncbi:sialic acid-binding Ig-like lectin 12 isoform X2 [Scyliorhinus torazame]|uniref:sialic acid-binding Ig-like lectin 12 isoform X2 n=1 Tax=Scyliorhinus torazame TaxID=75743 RepID=UPI003B59E83C